MCETGNAGQTLDGVSVGTGNSGQIQEDTPGGLVFKAHRVVYHSTLGLRVIKKKRRLTRVEEPRLLFVVLETHLAGCKVWCLGKFLGFRVQGPGFVF